MLQAFRTVINSLVGKVFFGILLLTFALLGVGYGFRDLVLGATTSNDAATVGGTAITLTEFDRQFRRQLQDAQRQIGVGFNPTPQQKQELAREILDKQIDNTLISEAAANAGFRVGDGLVRDVIQSEPAFAGMDHRFDAGKFRMLLENQGMNEAAFIPQIRASLTNQLMTNPIVGSAIVPKAIVDDLYRYRNEQRTAQTILVRNDSITGIAAPTDAEIDSYYKAHAAEFTAPEYRSFTVLDVTPALFLGEVKVTDDDLHAAYDQHKAEYIVPEQRKITQVVLTDKATADAVLKATAGGKSLADAAKAATNGKVQPIALDFLPKGDFPEALREPVFGAAKDATVGPAQTPLGWHVVKIDDIKAGHEVPFDDVKAKLTDQVKHDGAVDLLSQQIDKLGDKLTAGAPMDEVAAGVSAKPVKVEPVDAKGLPAVAPKDAAKPAAPDPAWVTQAFQLQQGETSSFQDDKNGGYYAVRLDAVTPPALKPLADVRAQIVADVTKERQAIAAAKRADELAAKAKATPDFAKVAGDASLPVDTTIPVTREPDPKATKAPAPALVDALFKLGKVGDITTVTTDAGTIVARLSDIKAADPKTAGEKLQPVVRELEDAMRADAMAEYRAGLRQSTKIKINPNAVETVAGQ
jgi:peptidyl-prolyl cis-trans isomerase D